MLNIKHATRKSFLKVTGVTAGCLLLGINFSRKVYAEVVDVVKARFNNVYLQDRRMKLRKSQDNPEIKAIYKKFLKHPLSHESHHLLHTEYVDRSATLKKS